MAELGTLKERMKKMGIVCPSCNHENLTRGEFCNNCRRRIWFDCPQCQERYPAGARYCSYCNTSLTESPVLSVSTTRLDFGRACMESYTEPMEYTGYYTFYNARRPPRFTGLFGIKKVLGHFVEGFVLSITNTGGQSLKIAFQHPEWLEEIGDTSIGGGQQQRFTVALKCKYHPIARGRHSGAITITSNGGNATVAVTVEVV